MKRRPVGRATLNRQRNLVAVEVYDGAGTDGRCAVSRWKAPGHPQRSAERAQSLYRAFIPTGGNGGNVDQDSEWWKQLLERVNASRVPQGEWVVGGHRPQFTIVVVQRADRDHGDGVGVMTHTTALADYVLIVEDTPDDPVYDFWVRVARRPPDAGQVENEDVRRVADRADYVVYALDKARGDALVAHLEQVALDEGHEGLREVIEDVHAQRARRRARTGRVA